MLNCSTCSTRPIFARYLSALRRREPHPLKKPKNFRTWPATTSTPSWHASKTPDLDISAGFIVGFDNDDESIFEDQYRFIQDNGIVLAMVGMLTAIPKTPLYERLDKEGRLRLQDFNCNFVPKMMTPEATSKWLLGTAAAALRAGGLSRALFQNLSLS